MERRTLGRTGIAVSALGFGCGSVGGLLVRGDPAEQTRAVARALEAGITYFDTAPSYGDGRSEENLGRVLKDLRAWERVVVGTKLRLGLADMADPETVVRGSVAASLRRLGRDAVDLVQLHNRVVAAPTDAEGALPLDAVRGPVAAAMRRLVDDGLARAVGFTGLGEAGAVDALARAGVLDTVQVYFNALNPSAGFAGAAGGEQDFGGLIDTAAGAGLGVIAIRVLAAGALAAREERAAYAGGTGGALIAGGGYAHDLERARTVAATLAATLGLEGPLELAVRFALSKPGISTVLVGFSDTAQLEEALRWAERGPLPDDAVRRVVAAAR
jgi:aryl-alcohol dehydrogenase-like predicted oxidoreductase